MSSTSISFSEFKARAKIKEARKAIITLSRYLTVEEPCRTDSQDPGDFDLNIGANLFLRAVFQVPDSRIRNASPACEFLQCERRILRLPQFAQL
jgi:hypothetical protein